MVVTAVTRNFLPKGSYKQLAAVLKRQTRSPGRGPLPPPLIVAKLLPRCRFDLTALLILQKENIYIQIIVYTCNSNEINSRPIDRGANGTKVPYNGARHHPKAPPQGTTPRHHPKAPPQGTTPRYHPKARRHCCNCHELLPACRQSAIIRVLTYRRYANITVWYFLFCSQVPRRCAGLSLSAYLTFVGKLHTVTFPSPRYSKTWIIRYNYV